MKSIKQRLVECLYEKFNIIVNPDDLVLEEIDLELK